MALPILFAAAFSAIRFPAAHHAQGFAIRDALQVARYPGVLLFAFLLFFESGAEATLQTWSPTFAYDLGASSTNSSWALAAYLACVMLGRILAARLLRNMRNMQLLMISGILGSAACLVLAFAPNFPALVLGCALVGLGTATIYPTTLAVVGDRYQRFAATVFSFVFTVALLGGWAFPKTAGLVSSQRTIRPAMLLPFVGVVAVTTLIFVLCWREEPAE
jgi:fucose permease